MSANVTDDTSKTATTICIENDGYVKSTQAMQTSTRDPPAAPTVKPFTVLKRTVLRKEPELVEFTCYVPDGASCCEAGQYVTVKPYACSKRIPIPVCDSNTETKTVSFVCRATDLTISKVVAFTEGQCFAAIAGPLGHPADFRDSMGHVVVVADIDSMGPLHMYAKTLQGHKGVRVTTIVGANTGDKAMIEERLGKLVASLVVIESDEASDKVTAGLAHALDGAIQDSLKGSAGDAQIDRVYLMGSAEMMRAVSDLTRGYGIETFALMSAAAVDAAALLGAFRVDLYKERPYLASIYAKHENGTSSGTVPNIDEFTRSNLNPAFSKANVETVYVYTDGPEVDAHRVVWDHFRLGSTVYSPAILLADDGKKRGPSTRATKPAPMQTPMPMQHPKVRCQNWAETSLGYTPEMAIMEASRCLQCKKPMCVKGCPVQVPIPQFIKKITEGDFLGAYKVIKTAHSCPSVTGRVCPQENQCQSAEGNYGCILCRTGKEPVGIGKLERFVADYVRENNLEDESIRDGKTIPEIVLSGYKVAVIGSGPAGLAVARECALAGHKVTIFEALAEAGGVLNYGIPKFRLPKQIVAHEVNCIKRLGLVEVKTNIAVGRDTTIPELKKEGYASIFIGTGVGIPRNVGIPGEDLPGVMNANEFLKNCNLKHDYDFPFINHKPNGPRSKVVVIGCGNVAMDCASSARRLGADVIVVYRRRLQDSPARVEEIEHAEQEGVQFATLNSPLEIIPNETRTGIKGLKCQVNTFEAGEIIPLDGELSFFACSMVIVAVGFGPNNIIVKTTENLKITNRGLVITSEDFETSVPGVFCAGDVQTGAATVIKALGNGSLAGQSMNFWIAQNHAKLPRDDSLASTVISPAACPHADAVERAPQDTISVSSSTMSLALNSDIEETLTTHI